MNQDYVIDSVLGKSLQGHLIVFERCRAEMCGYCRKLAVLKLGDDGILGKSWVTFVHFRITVKDLCRPESRKWHVKKCIQGPSRAYASMKS